MEKKLDGKEGTLLVGYSFGQTDNGDGDVLIVGTKRPKQEIDVVNAFQGEEARELYRRLTERRMKLNEEN